MVMTSPPYWTLRDYGVDGQLGLEPTFGEYIENLCNVFDEVKRVLVKDGTCWINLGDTYCSNGGGSVGSTCKVTHTRLGQQGRGKTKEVPVKSLCMIPQRFAIEMINRGWILRNEIIWHKPSCMPSSIKDRFTVDFEYLFFFSKSRSYYSEQQFEPHKEKYFKRYNYNFCGVPGSAYPNEKRDNLRPNKWTPNPKGRNKRSVWSIPLQASPIAHFATYPEKLVETPIKSGCPELVCRKCNSPIEKIFKRESNKVRFEGYTDCKCNAGFKPGIVLDPFLGSGTTALVALKLNKHFSGIEINPDYIKIAKKRIKPFLNQARLKKYFK